MDFEKDYLDNETLDENIEDLNKDEPFDEKELELESEKEEPEEQSKGGTKSANDPEPVYFEKFDDALVSDGQGGYTNLGEAVYAKDSGGRTEINELRNLVDNTDGTVHYKGTTTTALSNGSTTNPIVIDGEDYTAVFGDIAVYNYTEFVFDGTQWSEFGRPFDTTPTSGSANAVTSDGIYKVTPLRRGKANGAVEGGTGSAYGINSFSFGNGTSPQGNYSIAFGDHTSTGASATNLVVCGKYNASSNTDLFEIGNGSSYSRRSNIVEVNSTELNVNGDIKKNNVSLPTPYTTMPTITAAMLGQIAMYVGETTNDYVKGYFYIASSDGAAEPTYSWVSMVDDTPTSGSKNFVTSGGVYQNTPLERGTGLNSAVGGRNSLAGGNYAFAFGDGLSSNRNYLASFGRYNNPFTGALFTIGNGTSTSNRSNIFSVSLSNVIVNGDLITNGDFKRDGVGIDDYTTTERKIGKWIDGSDLYQRTFEVTELTESDQWVFNNNILGTSNIDIKDFKGYTEWSDGTNTTRFDLNFYLSDSIHSLCLNSTSDLAISLNHESTNFVKAIITIEYTKLPLQANLMQTPTEDVSETPAVEEDDMR